MYTDGGNTALHLTSASKNSTVAGISTFLDAGADVRARNDDGWTPLHHAALSGRFDIVSTLLDAGADAHAVDNSNRVPLDFAALEDHHAVILKLIETMKIE